MNENKKLTEEEKTKIAKEICERYSIKWDENATRPTYNGDELPSIRVIFEMPMEEE